MGLQWVDPDGEQPVGAPGYQPFQVRCEEEGWMEIARNDGKAKFVGEHYRHGTARAEDDNYTLPCEAVEALLDQTAQPEQNTYMVRLEVEVGEYMDGYTAKVVDYLRPQAGAGLCEMLTKADGVAYEWYGDLTGSGYIEDYNWHTPPTDEGAVDLSVEVAGEMVASKRALGGSKDLSSYIGDSPEGDWSSMEPQRSRLSFWGNEIVPGAIAAAECGNHGTELNTGRPFRLSVRLAKDSDSPLGPESQPYVCDYDNE